MLQPLTKHATGVLVQLQTVVVELPMEGTLSTQVFLSEGVWFNSHLGSWWNYLTRLSRFETVEVAGGLFGYG
jgi:hypothetical protein